MKKKQDRLLIFYLDSIIILLYFYAPIGYLHRLFSRGHSNHLTIYAFCRHKIVYVFARESSPIFGPNNT